MLWEPLTTVEDPASPRGLEPATGPGIGAGGVDSSPAGPSPRQGTALLLGVLILVVLLGTAAQAWSVYPGLVFTEVGLLLVPVLLFCRARGWPLVGSLGLAAPADGSLWLGLRTALGAAPLATGMAMGLTVPVVFAVVLILGRYPSLPLPLSESTDFLWGLAVGAVLAPVCEEILFRGFLLAALRPFGTHAAVWMSAVCFGIFHMDPVRFISTTALGVVFGYLAVTSGSIRAAILAHAVNNGLALSSVYFLGDGGDNGEGINYEGLRSSVLEQMKASGLAAEGTGADAAVIAGLLVVSGLFLAVGIALAAALWLWLRWLARVRRQELQPASRSLTVFLRRDRSSWGIAAMAVLVWSLATMVLLAA